MSFLKVAVINLLVLAALLTIAEALYRKTHSEPILHARTFPGQSENRTVSWARPDKDLGWVFSGTNLHTFSSSKSPWTASVNREGFRSRFDYGTRDRKPGITRVMMLGDSFLFGPYLNDADTLSSLLQEKLGGKYEVYNFGIPGWGVDQMFLAYLKYADIVDPDLVIEVYIDEDVLRAFEAFRRIEGMNKPSFKIVNGRLIPRGRNDRPGLFERMIPLSHMAAQAYDSAYRYPESGRIGRALFVEIIQESQRRGQRLVVVRYPEKEEILWKRDKQHFDFSDLFHQGRMTYLDPRNAMRASGAGTYQDFYLEDDGHPARGGNDFVASYIVGNVVLPQ